uniref:Reverse transcriptase RNase H-like domain-containing protein n=1 Tax=Lepisosteus oculatus TaxID=7918 RepID=W5NNB8_LEPOC
MPQDQKVQLIKNWPKPATKKQIRTFVGLASYYRRFIPGFAAMAAPLHDLTKMSCPEKIKWTDLEERAFQDLKAALTSQHVLQVPDFSKPFMVQTDASDTGIGAILSQDFEGLEHPILYISRKLNPAEKHYSTIEKECLAIKWALDYLKYYLLGRQFILYTDHAPLTWMLQNMDKNDRITRWGLSLQRCQFQTVYRPGRKQGNVDALSRMDCLFFSRSPEVRADLRVRECKRTRGSVISNRYFRNETLKMLEIDLSKMADKKNQLTSRWKGSTLRNNETQLRRIRNRNINAPEAVNRAEAGKVNAFWRKRGAC